MKKIKVMTLVGTRPEIIKLSRVIVALDRHTTHVLVHSGQNYDFELNEVFFKDLEIRKPDYFLEAAGSTACETIGNVISMSEKIIEKEKPDAFLIYGDTNSCLGALAAKRHKIPVFHMEAGNRCFDERVPEEINRRLLDHISDINMPLTEHGRQNLLQEGIRSETIIKTGSSMYEVLGYYKDPIAASGILETLGLEKNNYMVVSAHREENVDDPDCLKILITSIQAAAKHFSKNIIFSVHPRTRERIKKLGISVDEDYIQMLKPLGFIDYIKLQQEAFCVLSDSGTITEESSLLGFPAITIRNAHERPEGMDAGVLIMSGLKKDNVLQAISVVTDNRPIRERVSDYQANDVSTKVLHIIISYTPYIRQNVWHQNYY